MKVNLEDFDILKYLDSRNVSYINSGDISSLPYSPEFNKWLKTQIKKRDEGKCQNPSCKKNSNHFGVHHIDYDKENTANINLIYTCFSCNSRANHNRPYWKKLYTKIMKERFPNK